MAALFQSPRPGSDSLWIIKGILFLTAAALLISCKARDSVLFDDPAPEVVLSGILRKEPRGGGTFYWGDARNTGNLTAENVRIHIKVMGAGGVDLGTFVTSVGIGYDDVDETVMNDLDPGVQGSFKLRAPVSYQLITSETFFFTFTSPVEEE